MAITEAEISDAIRWMPARHYRQAEKDLDFIALCLIGPGRPIPIDATSNDTHTPVALRTNRDPKRAADRTNSEHWNKNHKCRVLELVWTTTDAFAERLKNTMYRMLLGYDPDMTQLEGKWINCPEWEMSWPILLEDAVREIRSAGERIEVFDHEGRERRIQKRARQMFRP